MSWMALPVEPACMGKKGGGSEASAHVRWIGWTGKCDYIPFYTKIVKWYISIRGSVPGSTKTLYLLVRYLHRRLLLPIF